MDDPPSLLSVCEDIRTGTLTSEGHVFNLSPDSVWKALLLICLLLRHRLLHFDNISVGKLSNHNLNNNMVEIVELTTSATTGLVMLGSHSFNNNLTGEAIFELSRVASTTCTAKHQ